MTRRVQFSESEEDFWQLMKANPLAFALLAVIAKRARTHDGFDALGLTPGQALLGDHENYGMTRQQYRTALGVLANANFATIKSTTKGTVVTLSDSRIFELQNVEANHQINQRPTNAQPLTKKIVNTYSVVNPISVEEINTLSPSKTRECEFLEFWKIYPRKVGRQDASNAWDIHCPPGTLAKIKQSLVWQSVSEQWTKDGARFIPHPATYLRQHRWEDEPPQQQVRSKPKLVV